MRPVLRVDGNPGKLERLARTRVQDLDSFAGSLLMHDAFIEKFSQLQPVLEELGGDAAELARVSQERFDSLVSRYERLGRPQRAHDDASRAYLTEVRRFSRELHDKVFELYPLKLRIEFVPDLPNRRYRRR